MDGWGKGGEGEREMGQAETEGCRLALDLKPFSCLSFLSAAGNTNMSHCAVLCLDHMSVTVAVYQTVGRWQRTSQE